MQNDKRLMIAICALIIAVALAYASYLYMPNLGQQPLHQNSLAMSPASRYAYAVSSDSTISTLSIPIMTQYSDCDVCGTEVKCPIGDCHLTHYVCKGVRTSLCITTSTSTSTTSTTKTTTIPTTSIHTTTSTSTTSTSTTTTSTTTTAFYSCDECIKPLVGSACPSNCGYQSSGPTNGCPTGYIACTNSTHPHITCGFLPPKLAQSLGSSEPWYCPINQSLYLSWQKDIPIAFIAVMIAFLIAGGIFMVGAGIKNNRIRNFGIGELYEAVASAIIVALFVYLGAVIFGLVPGVFVGAINPYAASLHLITTTINSAENVYSGLFHAYDYDMYLSTLTVDLSTAYTPKLNLIGTVINYALIPLDIYFIEPAAVVSSFIYDGILALYAEYYLIVFFAVAAIPVFLIPGVILRVFLPTRSLGGILIALAVGFYFVMPLLFAVAFYFTAPHLATQMNNVASLLNRYSVGKGAVNNAVTPTSPLVLTLSGINSSLNSFWLLILFYPALISAVTYAFVVQLANFIGGSARMSGRARAKFI